MTELQQEEMRGLHVVECRAAAVRNFCFDESRYSSLDSPEDRRALGALIQALDTALMERGFPHP